MKTISFLFIASLFSFLPDCGGNKTPRKISDLEKKELIGNVKTVVEASPLGIADTMFMFNKWGYITDVYSVALGIPQLTAKYQYAEDSTTLISIDYYNAASERKTVIIKPIADTKSEKFKFDGNGNITKISRFPKDEWGIEFFDGKPQEVIEYTYDKNNKVLIAERTLYGEVFTDRNTEMTLGVKEYWFKEYSYNAKGYLYSVVTKDQNKNVVGVEQYTHEYDSKNNWQAKYNDDKDLIEKRSITYYSNEHSSMPSTNIVAATPSTETQTEKAQPSAAPATPNADLQLPYATYTGDVSNGKANGQGKMLYTKRTQISKFDSKKRYAEKGQYVVGTWYNNNLDFGKLYDANGNILETLTIGRAE